MTKTKRGAQLERVSASNLAKKGGERGGGWWFCGRPADFYKNGNNTHCFAKFDAIQSLTHRQQLISDHAFSERVIIVIEMSSSSDESEWDEEEVQRPAKRPATASNGIKKETQAKRAAPRQSAGHKRSLKESSSEGEGSSSEGDDEDNEDGSDGSGSSGSDSDSSDSSASSSGDERISSKKPPRKVAKKSDSSAKKKSAVKAKSSNGIKREKKPVKLEDRIAKIKSRSKMERLEEARKAFKWWEVEDLPDGLNWRQLEHCGIYFPDAYEPHNIPLEYDGKEVQLTPEQEEIASFYAAMPDDGPQLGNPKTRAVFQKNFMNDFKEALGPGHVIKKFTLCNFGRIRAHLERVKELKKAASSEEKAARKKEREAIALKYGYALIDGRIEKVVFICRFLKYSLVDKPHASPFRWVIIIWSRQAYSEGEESTPGRER